MMLKTCFNFKQALLLLLIVLMTVVTGVQRLAFDEKHSQFNDSFPKVLGVSTTTVNGQSTESILDEFLPYDIQEVRYVSAAKTTAASDGSSVAVVGGDVLSALNTAKGNPWNIYDATIDPDPGTLIVLGDGYHYGVSSTGVPIQPSTNGTEARPIVVIAENDRQARLMGGTGGGSSGRAIAVNRNNWHFYNLYLVGRGNQGANDSNVFESDGSDPDLVDRNVLLAGSYVTGTTSDDMIKGTTFRGFYIYGNYIEPVSSASESGIDLVAVNDWEIAYNTLRGTMNDNGFQPKSDAQRGIFYRNDLEGNFGDQAIAIGGFGTSRSGRNMPFQNALDTWEWSEAHDVLVRENSLVNTNTPSFAVIDMQGAFDVSVIDNYLSAPAGEAVNNRSGGGVWWLEGAQAVPGEHTDYVTLNPNETFDYLLESRFNTFTGNRWAASIGTGFDGQNNSDTRTDNQSGSSPFTGDVGQDGWDRDFIYTSLGIVSEYPLEVTIAGGGAVSGDGINCSSSCSNSIATGTELELTATPDAGFDFGGWFGACTGTGTCSVTVSGTTSVTAVFIESTGTDVFACLLQDGPLEILSGEYTSVYRPDMLDNMRFDARNATFTNPGDFSHETVALRDGDGVNMCWAGGNFFNDPDFYSLDASWEFSKLGVDTVGRNTASVHSRRASTTFTGIYSYNGHDAIRVQQSDNNWRIQHTWIEYNRDDCIENDNPYSGVVYDSLFDGCYVGFSSRGSENPGQTVTIDTVLVRQEPMPYPYDWENRGPYLYVDDVPFGYGPMFKLTETVDPTFNVSDSVFLFEFDAELDFVFPEPANVGTCENNTIIWLAGSSSAPLYLLDDFPGCFDIITDVQDGLDFWGDKVTDWHNRHPDVGADFKPENPECYTWPRYGGSQNVQCADVNSDPVGVDDDFETDADADLVNQNILVNDTDADDDELEVTAVTDVAGSNGGTFTISTSGLMTFSPNGDFDDLLTSQDEDTTYTYTLSDGTATTTALITVTVNGVLALDGDTYPLNLTITGAGTVSGTGVNCTVDCTNTFASGSSTTLTATADEGYEFSGWSGACSGSGTCNLTLNATTSLTATFAEVESGGGGGGGGGGSSRRSNDDISLEISSYGVDYANILVSFENDGADDVFVVLSSTDRTPSCDDVGLSYRSVDIFPSALKDVVTNHQLFSLSANTKYYILVCADDDGEVINSSVESFTTNSQSSSDQSGNDFYTGDIYAPDTTLPQNFSFTRNISFNQPAINDSTDVQMLQQFLNIFEGESLDIDGNYGPEDNEAVKRFQLKHKREILDVWGLTEATGYVGITTRLKINFLLKGQTAQCPAFTEYNGGLSGITFSPEIGETQKILQDLDMYFGPINNTWDSATNQALITFQETFREVMLDPWNITAGTGYKYKTTNKFLNYFAGCDTDAVFLEGVGQYEGI